jgi:hypothetical protein
MGSEDGASGFHALPLPDWELFNRHSSGMESDVC